MTPISDSYFYKLQKDIFQLQKDENNWTCRFEKKPGF